MAATPYWIVVVSENSRSVLASMTHFFFATRFSFLCFPHGIGCFEAGKKFRVAV
jgi:hypothetical protein